MSNFFNGKDETQDWLKLGAELDKYDWQVPCTQAPDLYFPDHTTKSTAEGRGDLALANMAKDACWDCPVIFLCGEFAIKHKEQYGIWGGMNLADRKAIWKKQGRTNRAVGGRKKKVVESE